MSLRNALIAVQPDKLPMGIVKDVFGVLTMNKALRVAGYLRADSGNPAAFQDETHAFEERLRAHAGWECAGIYADNIPGGRTSPRLELERLVADCGAGKIDLIVTNDLTSLYEDTSESLQFVWEMQMLSPPVHIRLEEVGIDTRNPEALLYCMVFNYVIQEKRERAENSRKEQEATDNA